MENADLMQFDSGEELARAAATDFLRYTAQAGAGERGCCVALSGGRIARDFFSAVAELAKDRPQPLESVHFFWADERCVPPTDPECNFAIANGLLFAPLGISEQQIHRIRGETDPEAAAAEAAAELLRIARTSTTGLPVLDLVLLGMGEDGHVASLFPGEPKEASASMAVYRSVIAVKPPPRRITLGYASIVAAENVWALVSGPGKEAALRESLAPNGSTPLGQVLQLRQHTRVFASIPLA